MSQQLHDYINQSRSAGKTNEQIRRELLDSGWQGSDVDRVMGAHSEPRARRMPRVVALTIIVVLLLVGAGYGMAAQWFSLWPFEATQVAVSPTPSPSDLPTMSPFPSPLLSPLASPGPVKVAGILTVRWENALTSLDADGCQKEGVCNYWVGVIDSGTYAGKPLVLRSEPSMGGDSYIFGTVIDNRLVLFEETTSVRGISDIPKTIKFGDTKYTLSQGWRSAFFSDYKIARKLFTDPVLGDIFLDDKGCIVVELPDHTAMTYHVDVPFISEKDIPAITFSDLKQNADSYAFIKPSCGDSCYSWDIVPESVLKPNERIVAVGTSSGGEPIYGFKDANDPDLKALYNDKNTIAYFPADNDWNHKLETNRYSYEEFIGYHPYFFWKDPLGRWIRFRNNRFSMAAEMCKPVIYLYPTERTKVHVEVSPNGGFTHTEPAYRGGWDVVADPDGNLTDIATGKNYEYLFWEGMGIGYPVTDQGWVVAKENIGSFLDVHLYELGMRGKEISDFKEYWVPKLSEKPFYHLSFLRTRDIDRLAPLSISLEKPHVIVRVMMTAREMNEYQDIAPQEFSATPVRRGFTVVEWGGVLLK